MDYLLIGVSAFSTLSMFVLVAIGGCALIRRALNKDAFDKRKICINCEETAPASFRYCRKCGGTLRYNGTI